MDIDCPLPASDQIPSIGPALASRAQAFISAPSERLIVGLSFVRNLKPKWPSLMLNITSCDEECPVQGSCSLLVPRSLIPCGSGRQPPLFLRELFGESHVLRTANDQR